jgi:hypothetical protein
LSSDKLPGRADDDEAAHDHGAIFSLSGALVRAESASAETGGAPVIDWTMVNPGTHV